jgi:hypothetical protein
MTNLERHSRLLLRAYPAAYRRDRGEEIIGTLLEATPAGRSWPVPRDVRSLVLGGLRARAALNQRPTTAANLRIAALVGATAYLVFSAIYDARIAVWTLTAPDDVRHIDAWHSLTAAAVLGAAAVLAWVGSRRIVVLAGLTGAAVSLVSWLTLGFPWHVGELACLALLALCAGRVERPGRAWLWSLALAAVFPLVTDLPPGFWSFPTAAWLVAAGAVGLVWSVIDARPVIATSVFLLAFTLPSAIDDAGPPPGRLLMLILTAVAAFAVWRLHRQSARVAPPRED